MGLEDAEADEALYARIEAATEAAANWRSTCTLELSEREAARVQEIMDAEGIEDY